MNLLPKPLAFALTVATLFGCATTVTMTSITPEERQAIQRRQFNAPDSLIYTAAVSALVNIGFTIQTSDRALGLIQTAPLTYAPNDNQDALAGALIGYAPRFCRSVSVRIKDGTVHLNYSWQKTDRYGWRPYDARVSEARREYKTLFDWIRYEIGEQRGHDTE